MKRKVVLLIICSLYALIALTGCRFSSVRLEPIRKGASKDERKEFYERHQIVSRSKAGVRLGDGTRVRVLTPLKVLVAPKSETAVALAEYERFGRYAVIALSVGSGVTLAALGLSAFGIAGPIPNRARFPVILTGASLGGIAVIGTAVGFVALIFVTSGRRINERILRHYNDDLRANLKLPPRKKGARWRLPPVE